MAFLTNLDLILRHPLFAPLTAEQAEGIARNTSKRSFERGEFLARKNQRSNLLGILLAGRARVIVSDSRGREVILATLQQGDCFGEMSLIDSQPYTATIRTEVQTDVLLIEQSDFYSCLNENSAIAMALMKILVAKLRCANRRIESLALMNVSRRVATVLLDAAVQDDQGEWVVRYKLSRHTIAKMVGASREMVSRIVGELEESGRIHHRDDGGICVTALRKSQLY